MKKGTIGALTAVALTAGAVGLAVKNKMDERNKGIKDAVKVTARDAKKKATKTVSKVKKAVIDKLDQVKAFVEGEDEDDK